jgi:acetone carboxylase gamma subunit
VGISLVLARGADGGLQIECACGAPLGPGGGDWRRGCSRQVLEELTRGIVVHASLELVRYLCPSCGRQHAVEVAERGARPLADFHLAVGR